MDEDTAQCGYILIDIELKPFLQTLLVSNQTQLKAHIFHCTMKTMHQKFHNQALIRQKNICQGQREKTYYYFSYTVNFQVKKQEHQKSNNLCWMSSSCCLRSTFFWSPWRCSPARLFSATLPEVVLCQSTVQTELKRERIWSAPAV